MKKQKLLALVFAGMLLTTGCSASDIFSYTVADLGNDIAGIFTSDPSPEKTPETENDLPETGETPSDDTEWQDNLNSFWEGITEPFETWLGSFNIGGTEEAVPKPYWIEGNSSIAMPTMEQTVLLDLNGVTVTAEGLTQDISGNTCLELTVNNQSDEDMSLYAEDVALNGMMNNAYLSMAGDKAAAHTEQRAQLVLGYPYGADSIPTVGKLELSFALYNQASELTFGDQVVIETSAANPMEEIPAPEQKELIYDEQGVRIYLVGGEYNDQAAVVLLYMENNSDTDYAATLDQGMLDGDEADFTMYQNVLAGTNGYLQAMWYEPEAMVGSDPKNCSFMLNLSHTSYDRYRDSSLSYTPLITMPVQSTLEQQALFTAEP